MKIRILAPIVGVGLALCAGLANGQYPAKPIRIIVPVPAGGSSDAAARFLGVQLTKSLGQAVIVENKVGADGAIAGETVAKSPADGYTYLFANATTIVGVPNLRKNPPYDSRTAFAPVSYIGKLDFFLYTHPSVPVATLQQLIAYAKAHPGKLNYGTGNVTAHIAMSQLMRSTGISLVHIPYKGEGASIPDFLAGRFEVSFITTGSTLNYAREGRLRILATLGNERSRFAPEVPSMTEGGVSGAAVTGWNALFGPAKLPSDIALLMSREMVRLLARADVREQLGKQFIDARGSTPEELGAIVRQELALWSKATKDAGIEPE